MTDEMNDWDAPLASEPSLPDFPEVPPAWDDEIGALPEPVPEEATDLIRLQANPRADEVRDAILALPPGTAIRLEASAVSKLSVSMLQLILSACRTDGDGGSPVSVVDPSFAFTLAFEAFGFGPDNEPYAVEYA